MGSEVLESLALGKFSHDLPVVTLKMIICGDKPYMIRNTTLTDERFLVPKLRKDRILTQKAKNNALKVYQATKYRPAATVVLGTPTRPNTATIVPKIVGGTADSIKMATTPV